MKELRHIPVQKGKTYDISIARLGTSGEGVGRYEGFTVFVPFATSRSFFRYPGQ